MDQKQYSGTDAIEQEQSVNVAYERLQPLSIALGVAFIVLLSSLLQAILLAMVRSSAPALINEGWFTIVLSMLPMYLCAMPLSLLIFRVGTPDSPTENKRLGVPAFLGLVAICFVLTYIGNFIGLAVNALIGIFTGEPPVNDLAQLTMNTPLWANLLFCGIAAPILEEIFYRKLVIDRLRRYGELFAVIASGLLFGLIHGNFSQFFYAAMIGMVFGIVYLRTGKLRYTVGLHMAINLVGGVYATEMSRAVLGLTTLQAGTLAELVDRIVYQNPLPLIMVGIYVLFAVACVVSAPIALVILWKHIRFAPATVKLTRKQFVQVFLLNPAVWLLLGVTVLLFAV